MRKVVSILLAVAMLALPLPIAGAEVCLGCAEATAAIEAVAEMQAGHGCCDLTGPMRDADGPESEDDSSKAPEGECGCEFTCCVRAVQNAVSMLQKTTPVRDGVATTLLSAINVQVDGEPHLLGLKRPPRLTILV